MIHELRTYTLAPGKQGEYVKLASEVSRKIRGDKYGKLEGYWTTEFGTLNQVVHLWNYADLNERERLRGELARQNIAGERLEQLLAEGQKNILRDLVDNSLLTQKGKELSINVEAQVIRYLDDMRRQRNIATMEEFERWITENSGTPYEDVKERIRNQFLTQRVVGQEVSSRISVPREEIVKYYEEHKGEFVREEQVHLREIIVSTEGKEPGEIPALEKKAQDIAARLKKGERFADLQAVHGLPGQRRQAGAAGKLHQARPPIRAEEGCARRVGADIDA